MNSSQSIFKNIPSVSYLLEKLAIDFPDIQHEYLKRFIIGQIREVHSNPAKYNLARKNRAEFEEHFVNHLNKELKNLLSGSLHPVINATGIVLHTNLGRAPLNAKIVLAMSEVGRYSNLELNLGTGRRGQRNDHISGLLQLLTGADDGFAVNNNAAAVMLMLNTVGNRKEVILSRGEMIEIGGSFRLPEVMKMSGCKLHEVGTTNKTHLQDYREAINSKTGAILICHTSNYEVKGFTAKPELDDLISLAHSKDIPIIYDLGSGSFSHFSFDQNDSEPLVQDIVNAGVDLISFSGDKLLGGPQAGLIVGKMEWVKRCAKNHLLRALRLDKMMISALHTTLLHHLKLNSTLDTIESLNSSAEVLTERTNQFIQSLSLKTRSKLKVVPSAGQVGSGAYPTFRLPSAAIQINSEKHSASRIAGLFRRSIPPVLGYIVKDIFQLDLRAVSREEEEKLSDILEKILQN